MYFLKIFDVSCRYFIGVLETSARVFFIDILSVSWSDLIGMVEIFDRCP